MLLSHISRLGEGSKEASDSPQHVADRHSSGHRNATGSSGAFEELHLEAEEVSALFRGQADVSAPETLSNRRSRDAVICYADHGHRDGAALVHDFQT